MSASTKETKAAIAALLKFGSDLPQLDEDVTTDNALLVPIDPNKLKTVDDTVPSTSTSTSTLTSKLSKEPKLTPPVPVHKQFGTVEYKLKCK